MRYCLLISFLTLAFLLSSCSQRAALELTDKEQQCLDYIAKDPFMRVLRTNRESTGTLLVRTRQGEVIIMYRIDTQSPNSPDAVSDCIQVLNHHLPYQQVEK